MNDPEGVRMVAFFGFVALSGTAFALRWKRDRERLLPNVLVSILLFHLASTVSRSLTIDSHARLAVVAVLGSMSLICLAVPAFGSKSHGERR